MLLKSNNQSELTKFILLSRYRSGSNLLLKGLQQNKEIELLPELFNHVFIHKNPEKYLDKNIIEDLFSSNYNKKHVIGFKLIYDQATRIELADDFFYPNIDNFYINYINKWLENRRLSKDSFDHIWTSIKNDNSIKIIHLYRENQLESYISFQLAIIEGKWIDKVYNLSNQITIDKHRLKKWFENGDQKRQHYKNIFYKHEILDISYSELSNYYVKTISKCFQFLECKVLKNARPQIKKQNNQKIVDIVENYFELKEYFTNTKWSRYFIE